MKNMGLVAVAALALLLSGCAGTTAGASSATTVGEAPSVAPTPTGTPGQDLSDQYEPDDLLLLIVDKQWAGEGRPDDETLIAAGHAACDQYQAGANMIDIVVLPEASQANNKMLVAAATSAYCREG